MPKRHARSTTQPTCCRARSTCSCCRRCSSARPTATRLRSRSRGARTRCCRSSRAPSTRRCHRLEDLGSPPRPFRGTSENNRRARYYLAHAGGQAAARGGDHPGGRSSCAPSGRRSAPWRTDRVSWRCYVRRAAWDAERAAEIDAHLAHTWTTWWPAASADEARRAALRTSGRPDAVREEIDEMNSLRSSRRLARPPLRRASDAEDAGLHGGDRADARGRHRRQHGHLQRRGRAAAPAAALPAARPPCPRLDDHPVAARPGLAHVAGRPHLGAGARSDDVDAAVYRLGHRRQRGGPRPAAYVQQQRVGAGFFRVLGVAPIMGREFGPTRTCPTARPWRC